jgi:hydrogenase-4 component E
MMPFLLSKIVDNSGVTKVHRLAMPAFYTLLISIISLLISVVLAASMMNNYVSVIYMTIALFALFTGLILIVTHRLIVSHLIGFMIIENAVFFFSLAMGSKLYRLIPIQ